MRDDLRYPTVHDACRAAIDVQDASNLSGVVHTFADVCSTLMRTGECDSRTIRDHPAVYLIMDKLNDMTGRDGDGIRFSVHYRACKELANC